MSDAALSALDQAIAALTYDEIEQLPIGGGKPLSGDQIPLLQRSIAHDLVMIERALGGRGNTLLSATAAAIDQALIAIEEARQQLRPAHVASLKPAPLFLHDKATSAILTGGGGFGVKQVPIVPTKLVDRPRRSEDPRLAKANDDTDINSSAASTSADAANSSAGSGATEARSIEESRALEQESAPATSRVRAGSSPAPANHHSETVSAQPLHLVRRRNPVAAVEPRTSVKRADGRGAIRKSAQRLERLREAQDNPVTPRPSFGVPNSKPAARLPVLSAELRGRRLAAASAYLRTHAILVTVVDRDALVRKYRVSGKLGEQFAEEVIEIAVEHGFEAERHD